MKRLMLAALAPLAFAAASPAQAALVITPSAPAGTFGNLNVPDPACAGQCDFSDTSTFVTPEGFNTVAGTISSTDNGALTNLNFTSVTLNGLAFQIASAGIFEIRTLAAMLLTPGATNTLTVTGTSAGSGSYSGTLSFGAVPEPGTWGMMLLGFIAVGFVMRRGREQHTLVALRFA